MHLHPQILASGASISPDWSKYGSISPELARALEIAARCRLNIIISGGTGSGKTTLLNALSSMIDPDERIVTIEDAAELQLQQPHVIQLETRPPNIEGRGEMHQRDLVRNALRMRPDRIIVGEVRGPEAFDMLQAMNTGHDGSMSTIHANSRARRPEPHREHGADGQRQSADARDPRPDGQRRSTSIIQIERMRDGVRRVTEVSEVVGLEEDVMTMLLAVLVPLSRRESGRQPARRHSSPPACVLASCKRLEYFGLANAFLEAQSPRTKDGA